MKEGSDQEVVKGDSPYFFKYGFIRKNSKNMYLNIYYANTNSRLPWTNESQRKIQENQLPPSRNTRLMPLMTYIM